MDPEELAYKFPASSNAVDGIVNEESIQYQYHLTRGSPILDWSADSDSSQIGMRDTATSKDNYVPTNTDNVKYKLSWSSTISGGETSLSLYPTTTPTDIFPVDIHRPSTPGPNMTHMVKDGLSRHSSGYSNVIDDDDSASVGTEEFDNWTQGPKISADTLENGGYKGNLTFQPCI